jgi:hypothetical protein
MHLVVRWLIVLIILEKKKLIKIDHNSFDAARHDIEKILNTNFINTSYQINNKFFYSYNKGAYNNAFYYNFLEKNPDFF